MTRYQQLTLDLLVLNLGTPPSGAAGQAERQGTIVFASAPTRIRNWDLFTVDVASGEITRLAEHAGASPSPPARSKPTTRSTSSTQTPAT